MKGTTRVTRIKWMEQIIYKQEPYDVSEKRKERRVRGDRRGGDTIMQGKWIQHFIHMIWRVWEMCVR